MAGVGWRGMRRFITGGVTAAAAAFTALSARAALMLEVSDALLFSVLGLLCLWWLWPVVRELEARA